MTKAEAIEKCEKLRALMRSPEAHEAVNAFVQCVNIMREYEIRGEEIRTPVPFKNTNYGRDYVFPALPFPKTGEGEPKSKWTCFWDMHSGGSQKLDWSHIFIEAPEEEAKIIFYNRFDRNPERVTCTCCGEDYFIDSADTLAEATAYERGCGSAYVEGAEQAVYVEGQLYSDTYKSYMTMEEYIAQSQKTPTPEGSETAIMRYGRERKDGGVLIIRASEIKPEERVGDVPEEGYVWRSM